MSNIGFGTFVTIITIIVLMAVALLFLGPGHNMTFTGVNYIYRNFGLARNDLGL